MFVGTSYNAPVKKKLGRGIGNVVLLFHIYNPDELLMIMLGCWDDRNRGQISVRRWGHILICELRYATKLDILVAGYTVDKYFSRRGAESAEN